MLSNAVMYVAIGARRKTQVVVEMMYAARVVNRKEFPKGPTTLKYLEREKEVDLKEVSVQQSQVHKELKPLSTPQTSRQFGCNIEVQVSSG